MKKETQNSKTQIPNQEDVKELAMEGIVDLWIFVVVSCSDLANKNPKQLREFGPIPKSGG